MGIAFHIANSLSSNYKQKRPYQSECNMIVFSPAQPADQHDSAVDEIIEAILEAQAAAAADEAEAAAGYADGDDVAIDDDLDDLFPDEVADDEPDWDRIIDLQHLDRVVYLFFGAAADGGDIEIVVEEPVTLYVSNGDPNKYIEDAEGTGFIIGPTGKVTELHPKVGESAFA